MDIGQIVEIGDSIDKIEVDQGMNKIIQEETVRGNVRTYQNFERQNSRGEYRNTVIEMKVIAVVEIGTGLEKDPFSRNFGNDRNNRSDKQ